MKFTETDIDKIRLSCSFRFRGYTRWNKFNSSANSISRSGTSGNNNSPRYRSRRPISSRYRAPTTSTTSGNYKEYEFPNYDGTHDAGPDGFQYYLKKQYHEEERPGDKAVGSYGYVDPFGIRRVVYYKADGRNGFVHRKNNRYVGHDAKPYDPVPVAAEHALN